MKNWKLLIALLIIAISFTAATSLLNAQCEGSSGVCEQTKKMIADTNEALKAYVGKSPAALISEKTDWTNTSGKAVSLENLKDRVVYVEFGYAQCPMCQAQVEALNTWTKNYSDAGLVVIGVRPGMNTADDVKKQVTNQKISYPVLLDSQDKNAEAYGFSMLPTAFIIAPNNKGEQTIVWAGCPFNSTNDIEKVIVAELKKLAKK